MPSVSRTGAADCKCLYTHTHTYISGGKILNDVERYVKLLRRREEKGAEEGCNCGVAQSGRVIKVALCM